MFAVVLSLLAVASATAAPHSRSLLATPLPTFKQRFTAGVEHNCVVDNKNKGYCMGNGFSGQLGNGDLNKRNVPTPIKGNLTLKYIQAADWHSCAVTTDNLAYCWGFNGDGRCGVTSSNKTLILTPTKVAGGGIYTWISAGYFYTCGIKNFGRLFCWGKDKEGRLGIGSALRQNITVPRQVGTWNDWVEVHAGGDHTCGLRKGGLVYCWGSNNEGQLGVGKTKKELPFSTVPIRVPGIWKVLSANSKISFAINNNGRLYSWGSSWWGQSGTGSYGRFGFKISPTPVKVPIGVTGWAAVNAGQFVVCAITNTNRGYCWGSASSASSKYTVPQPVFPTTLGPIVSIAAGDWSAAAVTSSGSAYALWENEHGEGGVGSTVPKLKVPTLVKLGKVWGLPKPVAGK